MAGIVCPTVSYTHLVSMYPTLETIRRLAQTKEYRRIPLCRELYADRYTPVEVMRILRKASRHCYLLESASQTEVWGRYSFLGYEPSMEITCTDGTLKIRTTDAEGKTEETVRQVTHPVSYTHLDVYKRQVHWYDV